MPRRILNIIESAYRATIEEQDDTIIWLSYMLREAGAEIRVLLRGNAVNYAVAGQDSSGLTFGARRQTQPPHLDSDLLKLLGNGVPVLAVAEDLTERGIEPTDLVAGIKTVARDGLAKLLDSHDLVWHW
jgi:sulfur relay (sulfurtransferase) DsrF/TusC family protein